MDTVGIGFQGAQRSIPATQNGMGGQGQGSTGQFCRRKDTQLIRTPPFLRLPRPLTISVHHTAFIGLNPTPDAADHYPGLQLAADLVDIVLHPSSTAEATVERKAFRRETFITFSYPSSRLSTMFLRADPPQLMTFLMSARLYRLYQVLRTK